MTDDQIFDIAEKAWQSNRGSEREFTIDFARALLAAGASEGQAEPVAWRWRLTAEINGKQWGPGPWEYTLNPEKFESRTLYEVEPLYLSPSAEIAALRERIANLETIEAASDDEIERLRERIAGMEKDAEDAARYRWLEGQAKCDPKMGGNHHWWGINLRGVHGPTLAIGIDAAIAKEQK